MIVYPTVTVIAEEGGQMLKERTYRIVHAFGNWVTLQDVSHPRKDSDDSITIRYYRISVEIFNSFFKEPIT